MTGNLSRNCTESGWSSVYPVITDACGSNDTDQPNEVRVKRSPGHKSETYLYNTLVQTSFRHSRLQAPGPRLQAPGSRVYFLVPD